VRRSRTVWLIAVLFFGFTATAHSQGKWVLWSEMSGAAPSLPGPLHQWMPGQSFTTEAACQHEVAESLARLATPEPMQPPVRLEKTTRGNVFSMTIYVDDKLISTQSHRIVCLPTPWTRVGRRRSSVSG